MISHRTVLVSIIISTIVHQSSTFPSGSGYAQWQPLEQGYDQSQYGQDLHPQASHFGDHDYSSYGSEGGGEEYQHSYPVNEHVEVSHPEVIPNYKYVKVAIPKPFNIHIPHPILVPVPHPYPIQIPVNKPVAVPLIQEIVIPIEKIVPVPVEKSVPVPVEKRVPYKVEKHVPVHIEKPYPVKIPYIKTIYHSSKGKW